MNASGAAPIRDEGLSHPPPREQAFQLGYGQGRIPRSPPHHRALQPTLFNVRPGFCAQFLFIDGHD
jgi:hypothetical protein